ncbi:hypothetical protein F4778DRAFT_171727 [Xylariomycetidae sp. FL2044]|nr:hypothetical protein F4778DRAFT_171727 [Xylariomycetidae sp. FL2044]
MGDVYRRTGRGGAGNFYSQKDIEEAAAKAHSEQDIEAQKPTAATSLDDDEPPTDPADPPISVPASRVPAGSGGYARTGRGGAGNYVDPAAPAPTEDPPQPPPASVPSPQQQHQQNRTGGGGGGLVGRGGAGNWAPSSNSNSKGEHGGEPYDAEQERRRKEALDANILKDIRESLPQPPKIHYMHGPGRGRKPEADPDPEAAGAAGGPFSSSLAES